MLIIKRKKNLEKLSIEHFEYFREMNQFFLNRRYPFQYRHEDTNIDIDITVSDDARILSDSISNTVQFTDDSKKRLKNKIRKFQLEKAIKFLRSI